MYHYLYHIPSLSCLRQGDCQKLLEALDVLDCQELLEVLVVRLLEVLMAMRVTFRVEREEGSFLVGFINNNSENNDDSNYNSNYQYIYN